MLSVGQVLGEKSWYHPNPIISLGLIKSFAPQKHAHIVDVGVGHSCLVDHLLYNGYKHVTVVEKSKEAIDAAKRRLGQVAALAHWVLGDVLDFEAEGGVEVWHDRSAFHFLAHRQAKRYARSIARQLINNGILIIGTFSGEAPVWVNGQRVHPYSRETLLKIFGPDLCLIQSQHDSFPLPGGVAQEYLHAVFQKKAVNL